MIPELSRRPLPSFDKWLTDHGDGTRGDGFAGFVDLAQCTHESGAKPAHLTDDEIAFLRFWMGIQVAVTELCRIEEQKGRTPAEIILTMPRVLGAAAVYAVASVVKDEAPMRQIAKILIDEFRFAAKQSADQIEESRR